MSGRSESVARRAGVIKPFRSQQRMDDAQASKILEDLKRAIHHIHNQNASALSFEELYRNAYNLVLHKHGEKLYSGIEKEVQSYLRGLGAVVAQASNQTLLGELVEKWRTHTTTMTMIRDILMYMDRTFAVQEKKEPVYELGLRIFKEQVARHPNVQARALGVLLDKIQAERNGELVERDVIRNVLQMEVDLGISTLAVYEEDFEAPFLAMTRAFYQAEARQFIEANTCPDYIVKAEARLAEERARAQHYLHASTEDKLLRLVAEETVVAHAAQLVNMANSGCRVMMRDDKVADLARMYRLFAVKNCRDVMRQCMYDFVKETGERLVDDHSDAGKKPVDFVGELLELQAKFDRLVREAFAEDKAFQKAVKEAFEFFVNKNQRTSQYLSMYLDDLMRNKIRVQSHADSELNHEVDRVVVLFRYLQDKDIFENFYKQQLAKRLLSGRSVSEDAESSIIKKLKTECGYLFTSKLEGMFKDMKLSKETMDKYLQAHPRRTTASRAGGAGGVGGVGGVGVAGAEAGAGAGAGAASSSSSSSSSNGAQAQAQTQAELHVTVLTTGYWPTAQATPCNIPRAVLPLCEEFEAHYLGCHSGRKLSWQTNLGNGDLKARFSDAVTHEFNVSTYQMCALLLFNDVDTLSFREIAHATAVPVPELQRHLLSLAAPKFRVLTKSSKGKSIDADTRFTFNANFASKHYRVRIPLISAREKLGGAKGHGGDGVPEQVEEDRKHLTEAAIVRIMKARKQLEHNLLVAEVTKQMSYRFSPTPASIKKRIESLIEREYLKRLQEDMRVYQYLA